MDAPAMTREGNLGRALYVLPSDDASREQRWEEIYRTHVHHIYRFIFSKLGNRPDAEDVTAQVFLQALPRLRTMDPADNPEAYLFVTARSAIADYWRNRYKQPETTEFSDTSMLVDFQQTATDESHTLAHDAIASLPEQSRRVLELRFLQGYSLKETASAMGTTVGNIKVLQWRALRKAADAAREESS